MPQDQRLESASKIVAEAQKTTGPQPILFCPEQAGQWQKRALDIDSECRGRVRPDALEADPVRSARRAVSRRRRKARKGGDGCCRGDKAPYVPDVPRVRSLRKLRKPPVLSRSSSAQSKRGS